MYIVEPRAGTKIACRNIGQGSPVLLVHGTSADASRWDPIVDMLSYHFNVYLMDRRGRGASGDTLPYEPAREFEDVAAVIEAIGRPTAVVGHSFGGLCALEAALLTPHVRKLVLYEPTTRPAGLNSLYPSGSIERLEARLAVDDRAGLVESFMREVVRASPEDVSVMRAQRAWPQRLAAAHTIPRELRAHRDYIFLPERFAEI
jgi:pimeloyl-ACP methyl ester carboxylesterase